VIIDLEGIALAMTLSRASTHDGKTLEAIGEIVASIRGRINPTSDYPNYIPVKGMTQSIAGKLMQWEGPAHFLYLFPRFTV